MKLFLVLAIVLVVTVGCSNSHNQPSLVTKGNLSWLVDANGTPQCGSFMEITKQPDGKYLAQIGSLFCLLDSDGRQISQGYMQITKQDNGSYLATLGSMTYFLDAKGDQVSQGFMTLTKTESGYLAQNGTKRYVLDHNGEVISVEP